MGKDIRVFAYDDLDGKETEAKHTDVRLAWGKDEVTLDLSDYNFNSLEDFLRRYIKVGTPAGRVNPGGAKRGRKPHWFYEGMQRFAAEQGVDIPRMADGKLQYPRSLRRAWEAEIARRGNEQQ